MAPLNKNRSIANRAAALALWEAKFPLKKIREATGYSERQIRRIRVRATERGYDPKSSAGFKDEFFKDELRPGRRGKSKFISTTTTENSTTGAATTTITTTATEAATAVTAPVTTEGIAVADLLQAQKVGEQKTGEEKAQEEKDEHDDDSDSEMDEYGEGE